MKHEAATKEQARYIYLKEDITQKDLAARLRINEKTIKRWITEGDWAELKTSIVTTKMEQLRSLYKQLQLVNEENIAALSDDDPQTKPNTDAIAKLSKAIKQLEGQSSTGEIISMAMELTKFVQKEDLEAAKIVVKWVDLFVKDRLSQIKS